MQNGLFYHVQKFKYDFSVWCFKFGEIVFLKKIFKNTYVVYFGENVKYTDRCNKSNY